MTGRPVSGQDDRQGPTSPHVGHDVEPPARCLASSVIHARLEEEVLALAHSTRPEPAPAAIVSTLLKAVCRISGILGGPESGAWPTAVSLSLDLR